MLKFELKIEDDMPDEAEVEIISLTVLVLWGTVLEVPEVEVSDAVQGIGTMVVEVRVESSEDDQEPAGYVEVGNAPVNVLGSDVELTVTAGLVESVPVGNISPVLDVDTS